MSEIAAFSRMILAAENAMQRLLPHRSAKRCLCISIERGPRAAVARDLICGADDSVVTFFKITWIEELIEELIGDIDRRPCASSANHPAAASNSESGRNPPRAIVVDVIYFSSLRHALARDCRSQRDRWGGRV
jgi:hypothetical protein